MATAQYAADGELAACKTDAFVHWSLLRFSSRYHIKRLISKCHLVYNKYFNDTGDLILKTGASDEDMIFQGNDGGSGITALTLDMSAAGAATFNSAVTGTSFNGIPFYCDGDTTFNLHS